MATESQERVTTEASGEGSLESNIDTLISELPNAVGQAVARAVANVLDNSVANPVSDVKERLGHIEGSQAHFATKADVAEIKGELKTLKWTGLGIAVLIAAQIVLGLLGIS